MTTIVEHVTGEYVRLTRELHTIASNLAERQAEIATLQTELGQHKRDRDALKAGIVITRGGYSLLGKNETDREYTLNDICNRIPDYRELDNNVNRTADEIAMAESDFKSLCRQYNAVAHQSQLTAGMITMLAAPAGLSLADQPVPIPSPDPTRGAQPEDLGL